MTSKTKKPSAVKMKAKATLKLAIGEINSGLMMLERAYNDNEDSAQAENTAYIGEGDIIVGLKYLNEFMDANTAKAPAKKTKKKKSKKA